MDAAANGMDLKGRDDENISTLHWASINGKTKVVEYLLQEGVEVDAIGGELNGTPLQWAVRYGHLDTCVMLVKHGADPSIVDVQGFNALHLAAQFGFPLVCAYLISSEPGVDVDSTDPEGQTALMWACIKQMGPEIPRVLIALGASINTQCKAKGFTAMHFCVKSGNIGAAKVIVDAGANVHVSNEDGEDVLELMVSLLKQNPSDTRPKQLSAIMPREVPDGCMTSIFNMNPFRRMILLTLPYFGLGLVGMCFEMAKLDIFKGAGMLGATVILWIQIYSICNRYMTPQEQLEVPGGMAVYLGTKCMFFTYFFLELFPYTQGENALTGYAWDTAVVFFSCSLWYNWYKTHTSDPGYLPSATDKPREAARDITRLAEQGKLVKENFCLSCCIRKPIRSKHDSFTNKCVARFDHYCPFVGNPVGGDNHKYFMYFVMSLSPLVLLYTVLLFRYMAVVCPDTDGFFDMIFTYAYCKPFAAWTIFHGCLHTLWTSGLAMAQINQIFSDLTTNEAMNRFRYSYLSRGSPWSKGCMGNVLEFFCRQSLNWKTMYELPNSKMTV